MEYYLTTAAVRPGNIEGNKAMEITISISDEYVNQALEALTELSGKNIEVAVYSDEFNDNWSYTFAPKDGEETNQQFAIRAVKETIKALIRLQDYVKDQERYRTEVEAINLPSQDVPDEIVE